MTEEAERERLGKFLFDVELRNVWTWDEVDARTREDYRHYAEALAVEVRAQERERVAALVAAAREMVKHYDYRLGFDDPEMPIGVLDDPIDDLRDALAALDAGEADEDG